MSSDNSIFHLFHGNLTMSISLLSIARISSPYFLLHFPSEVRWERNLKSGICGVERAGSMSIVFCCVQTIPTLGGLRRPSLLLVSLCIAWWLVLQGQICLGVFLLPVSPITFLELQGLDVHPMMMTAGVQGNQAQQHKYFQSLCCVTCANIPLVHSKSYGCLGFRRISHPQEEGTTKLHVKEQGKVKNRDHLCSQHRESHTSYK